MSYENYKKVRNLTWRILIDSGVRRLPVDLSIVAKHLHVYIYPYSISPIAQAFSDAALSGDAFCGYLGSQRVIFLNDKVASYGRRRFTLAHEFGHFVAGHALEQLHFRHAEHDDPGCKTETEATVFARSLLMPAMVLHALDAHTPEQIMQLCGVSLQSAEIRAERLTLLRERGMFGTHPLERQMFEQFSPYINSLK